MENSEGPQINLAPKLELNLSDKVKQELGPQNLENLISFSQALIKKSNEQDIDDFHLLLAGGTVDPKKQGKFHKDIDLVIYAPELTVDPSIEKNDTKFNKFVDFLSQITTSLGWQREVKEPHFDGDYMYRFDGSVNLIPPTGVPFEIVANSNTDPMPKILEIEKRPYLILF